MFKYNKLGDGVHIVVPLACLLEFEQLHLTTVQYYKLSNELISQNFYELFLYIFT